MIKIYESINKINGKKYIGQTRCDFSKRKKEHYQDSKHFRDSCPRFHKAIRKYGFENFKWNIIYKTNDQNDADEKEIEFIKILADNRRYNILENRSGTYIRTPEIRKKISESKSGQKPWNTGEKLSEEHKNKISENHMDVSGKLNPGYGKQYWFGKKHSTETKEKMSEKAKQRKRDKTGKFIKENK